MVLFFILGKQEKKMADFSMQTGPESKLTAAPHVLTLRLLSAVESNVMWIFL